jgi:hypothetical protein
LRSEGERVREKVEIKRRIESSYTANEVYGYISPEKRKVY